MAAEPTNAKLPFGMGSVDLTDPSAVVFMVGSLVAGFAIFHMTSDIGSYAGSRLNQMLGGVLGFNPATGSSDDGPDVV